MQFIAQTALIKAWAELMIDTTSSRDQIMKATLWFLSLELA